MKIPLSVLKSALVQAAIVAPFCLMPVAHAADDAPSSGGTPTVLPRPDFHFQGKVGRTFQESDPATFPQMVRPPKGAPNVVVILLDDVGFGQFDVSGGLVPSPNMDKLAADGLLYNRFHTTALCSPTRASLLTGDDPHVAGTGMIPDMATGYDGYTSIIPKSTGTVAQILQQNGYATAWIGKNHNVPLWETSEVGPFDHWADGLGFDYFYGFNSADTDQYTPHLFENRTRVPRPTDPHYQLTTDLADHAIAWVKKERAIDPERPYFLYVAPGATHSPHQVSEEWIRQFKGKFDMGWDKYREMVLERQKRMGIVPPDTQLTKRSDGLPAWDSLNADQKRLYAHMMEVFAAYGAYADHEMGRVIDYVHSLPDADNTMIVYIVGDNGASAEGGLEGAKNSMVFANGLAAKWQDNLKAIDELGGPKHNNHFPAEWAHAMDTPFQYTKQVASHFGGTRNPLIISWPARIKDHGVVRSQFSHVMDIAPTILQAAGITQPTMLDGVKQKPMEGVSLVDTFDNPDAPDRHTTLAFEMVVNRGIYHDGWFASSLAFAPWLPNRKNFDIDKTKWELYRIDHDFSQADDLAAQYPEKLAELKKLWWSQAQANNFLPLDWRAAERFSDQLSGRPSLAGDRKTFVYDMPLAGLPESVAPNLKNKSFTITAEVDIPAGGANGMLFQQGGDSGGWGFYAQQGKLVAEHNWMDLERYRVVSAGKLPAGKTTLVFDFKYDGGGMGKGGTATLYANGKKIGEGRIERTVPFLYSSYDTQDIGQTLGTPVDNGYKPPFGFNGKIDRVTVELK